MSDTPDTGSCSIVSTADFMALKRELSAAQRLTDDWHNVADGRAKEIVRLNTELAAAQAEIAALREDAERYRLLRVLSRGLMWTVAKWDEASGTWTGSLGMGELDAAIDAAVRGE